MGITDLDFGCGLSLAKYSGDGDLDHDLGDHGDGDHEGIFVFFVDYSLAHEVGRVRHQL